MRASALLGRRPTIGFAIFVVVVLLASFVSSTALAAPTASTGASVPSAGGAPLAHAATAAAPAKTSGQMPRTQQGPAPPSSGRGSFWVNSPIDQPSNTTSACPYSATITGSTSACLNDTGAPAIAVNSAGDMVTATTTFTNATSCPGEGNYTQTEVGISVSTNGGTSWGRPTYVVNPGCIQPENYTSAMWPALTTLGNGTFVLAYLEYNVSQNSSACATNAWYYFPDIIPCITTYDKLVVSESFNGGASWTAPVVVASASNAGLNDTSPLPEYPTLAAKGNEVYLAWNNFTDPNFYPYPPYSSLVPSVGLNLVASSNGGVTWGTVRHLPVEIGTWTSGTTWVAYGPSLAINSTGALSVAYSTNLNYISSAQVCQSTGCGTVGSELTMDVVVATSTNHGANFSLSTVATSVPVTWNGVYTWIWGTQGALIAPVPSIAINPSSDEVYVTYAGGAFGTWCYAAGSCIIGGYDYFENVWLANSTDGGATWSTPLGIGDGVLGIYGAATEPSAIGTPSVAVGANGTVFLNAEYDNESACIGYYCDLWSDLVFTSTDNGSSFPTVSDLSGSGATEYDQPLWDGTHTAIAIYDGAPFVAWTDMICSTSGTAYCFTPNAFYTGGYSQVVVSTLYEGAGITLSFNETGLPSSSGTWSASLAGNARSGPVGTNLTVSGVPPLVNLTWSITPVATSTYGIDYRSVTSPTSPANFSASSTIAVDFLEYAVVQVTTVPGGTTGYPFYCGTTTFDYCGNENVTPLGISYALLGSTLSYSVLNGTLPAGFCFGCFNLSFQSWTGTGAGSWNTTLPNGSSVIHGPVNESANFVLNQGCYSGCFNLTYPYTFNEVGLPANTSWAVTLGNMTNTTTLNYLTFDAGFGPYPFTVWTVSYNSTYEYVGTASTSSPITATQGIVTVTFVLEPISSAEFATNFVAANLPSGVNGWGLDLGGTLYGVPSGANGTTVALTGGGSGTTLDANEVYGNAGVGGVISSFTVTPDQVGASPYSIAPGGSLTVIGPTQVVAQYSPTYWLDLPTPSNGTINQTSQWVNAGGSVEVTATPAAGYAFVGWSGSGTGSRTTTSATIRVSPGGPVTEVATFAAIPLTYSVTVTASGLPAGGLITFVFGGTTYTGASPIVISGIVPGNYSISAPTVVINNSAGAQYPVSGIASTLEVTPGVLDVDASGTVTVTYAAQFLLTVNPVTNGTVTPSPGTYWETGGSSVSLTATPATGFVVVGWTGSGEGSTNATTGSTSVTMNGPILESVTFAPYVAPPAATFSLVLTASGLPAGTLWSASIGATAVQGTGALTFTGLNGTYSVAVGTVSPATGVEYVPAASTFSVTVTSATPYAVNFTTMYEVTVGSTSGGTVSPATSWVASGATVTLTATAASGYEFVSWSGGGSGSYTGTTASTTFTATGPVTEFATFQATPAATQPTNSSGSSSPSLLVPILALVALLIVGLIAGLLLGRAGGGRSPPPEEQPPEQSMPADSSSDMSGGPSSEPPADPEAGGDAGEETVYGGGSA